LPPQSFVLAVEPPKSGNPTPYAWEEKTRSLLAGKTLQVKSVTVCPKAHTLRLFFFAQRWTADIVNLFQNPNFRIWTKAPHVKDENPG